MLRRWALAAGAVIAVSAVFPALSATAQDPDALMSRAREVWANRAEAAYVQYGVRWRFEEGANQLDRWYELTFRASDGALAIERIRLEGDEARQRGFALTIFGVPLFDTNPDAAALAAMREPAIEPAFTFGLIPRGYRTKLLAPADDATPNPFAEELPEIGRVIATSREYRVTLLGIERLRYGAAYHLSLVPLRDPHFNRLRDLWISTDSYQTLQERVAGILDTKPYDSALWTVRYVPLDGRMYIQQISTDESLRFGERRVSHAQLDFVDYRFPRSVPAHTFERWF